MKFTYQHTKRICHTSYITQAIVTCFLPLLFIVFQDQFHLSYEKLGTLIFANFFTQMLVDVIAIKFADRIGHRRLMILAHSFCAVGFACVSLLPMLLESAFAGLLISVFIYSCGGGILEVLISPLLESLPAPAAEKTKEMSLLHAVFCAGQIIVIVGTTGLLYAVGSQHWWMISFVWTLVPIYNIIMLLFVPLPPNAHPEELGSVKLLIKSKRFMILLVGMLCGGALELIMSQWASIFVGASLNVTKTVGDLVGPAFFAVMMGTGRIAFGVYGGKLNLVRVMKWGAMGCFASYILAILPLGSIANIIGCALVGLFVSITWPGIISVCAKQFRSGGTAMFALLAMSGDLGGAFGPWLAGMVADQFVWGLKAGLFVGLFFAVLLFLCLGFLQHERISMQMRDAAEKQNRTG